MNDDDAFLRAVLADPNDVALKLIYADWLDERDDPRGPYLRLVTEHLGDCDAFQHRQPFLSQLRQAGQRLDPLWKARITPPPLGVHTQHLRWHDLGPSLALARLEHYEAQLHVKLPVEYRAFLLNQNGGSPWPNVCRVDHWYYERVVDFHAIGVPYTDPNGRTVPDGLASFAERMRSKRGGHSYVPIASLTRHRDPNDEDGLTDAEQIPYWVPYSDPSGLALHLESRQILRFSMLRNAVQTELYYPSLGALLGSLQDLPRDWEVAADDD